MNYGNIPHEMLLANLKRTQIIIICK